MKRKDRQRGIALAEFALTVPIFLLLLVGMLEYGYYFYVAVSASAAAREGARQCTLVSLNACGDCDPSDAVGYMDSLGLGDYTSASASCATSAGTFMYTVDVTVDFPTLTGYMTRLDLIPASATDGNTFTRAVSVMRGQ